MGAAVLRLWAYALHLLSRHLMHVLALACKIMKAQCMHQTTGASWAHEGNLFNIPEHQVLILQCHLLGLMR